MLRSCHSCPIPVSALSLTQIGLLCHEGRTHCPPAKPYVGFGSVTGSFPEMAHSPACCEECVPLWHLVWDWFLRPTCWFWGSCSPKLHLWVEQVSIWSQVGGLSLLVTLKRNCWAWVLWRLSMAFSYSCTTMAVILCSQPPLWIFSGAPSLLCSRSFPWRIS